MSRKVLLLLIATLQANCLLSDYVQYIVRDIDSNSITYEEWTLQSVNETDISDLSIDRNQIKLQGDAFFNTFRSNCNYRQLLITYGCARVESAPSNSDVFKWQKLAQDRGNGIWAKKKSVSESESESSNPEAATHIEEGDSGEKKITWIGRLVSNISALFKKAFILIIRIWPYLVGCGLFGMLLQFLHKKLFIERKIDMLLIGEPDTGKTSIRTLLFDEQATPEQIITLSASQTTTYDRFDESIPMGKYQVTPSVKDIAGSHHEDIYDTLFKMKRKYVLLYTVSPLQGNQSLVKSSKYMQNQLVSMKHIVGAISTDKVLSPSLFLFVINKFDLLNSASPEDTTSQEVVQKLMEDYQEHISYLKTQLTRANIPWDCIITSSVKKWGIDRIMNMIRVSLFKKRRVHD